ncbi:MAG: nucleotidyl transferase AbiEii/AbiGii toxin family protein [Holosporales bacterium]|jgi:predicted nucleotidyltransferase component of viral defense system|nr:nucleotidyl transferase AbiEii/AbiGii toxin family protein [Holosporales bacterium]
MNNYYEQVRLLVALLPHIAKEDCFALKGGTAINLFVRDMPRLSVDIDLQYIYVDDRQSAFANINGALERIVTALQKIGFIATLRQDSKGLCKIICSDKFATVKVEPNYVIRGCIIPPSVMQNSLKVQETYGFASIQVLSFGELFGGKICAALDRQHPRDLFDIQYLLNNEKVTQDVKLGFIVSLLSHNRPPHEILMPNIQQQYVVFAKEFAGMTEEKFSYEDHVDILQRLIDEVNAAFTDRDKTFLISFFDADPKWNLVEANDLQKLPAIKWKIKNLKLLKENNSQKFAMQLENLCNVLAE